jgi:hypothetical protein
MIAYYTNVEDFWTEALQSYKFPHSVSTGQNAEFHENYNSEQNNLLQGFDEELPAVCSKFYQALNLKLEKSTISWTCIRPGNTIPIHQDKFYKLRTKYNVDVSQCIRFLVFLEDWHLGHYIEFDTQLITKWRKGDVWMFNHESPHCAANASHKNFYSCQINIIEDNDVN